VGRIVDDQLADLRNQSLARNSQQALYFWRVRILHKKGSFDRFDETLTFSIEFV